MMNIIRFLLVALLVFIAVTVAAFVYLQWWQALIVVFAMIFGMILCMKLVVRSFVSNIGKAMFSAFEIKAKVLRDATAEIHSIEAVPVPPPPVIDQAGEEDEDESDADEEPKRNLNYYRIDFTIRPTNGEGPMHHWDVSDLCVVDVNAPALNLKLADDNDDAGEGFHLDDVQILQDGQMQPEEDGKYQGTQRLSAVVGVPPGLRELKFRYYTEQFGRIVLPPPYPRDDDGAGQPVLA